MRWKSAAVGTLLAGLLACAGGPAFATCAGGGGNVEPGTCTNPQNLSGTGTTGTVQAGALLTTGAQTAYTISGTNATLNNLGTITDTTNPNTTVFSIGSGNNINNSGTIANTSATPSGAGGAITTTSTSTLNNVTNSGTVSSIAGNGIIATALTGSFTNAGTISAPRGSAFDANNGVAGNIINSGSIDAARGINAGGNVGGSVSNSGAITGNCTTCLAGTTPFNNGIVLELVNVAGNIANSGTINVLGGIALQTGSGITGIQSAPQNFVAGGVMNSGTLIGQTGANLSIINGVLTNSGTMQGSGGAGLNLEGTVHGGIFNTKTGKIQGLPGTQIGTGTPSQGIGIFAGALQSAPLNNAGLIRSHGGTAIVVAGSSTPNCVGCVPFLANLNLTNSGTITGGGGTALDYSKATTSSTITQAGGSITGNILLSPFDDKVNVTGGTITGSVVGNAGTGTVNFALGSNTLTFGAGSGISGVNSINLNSGSVILNGVNSATTTTLGGGNLQVGDAANPGATLTGTVNVNSGVLSGHGTVNGPVTIGSSGTLFPGGSIGVLAISGSLFFSSGSTYGLELSPTQHSSTLVNGAPGTVTINGGNVQVTTHFGNYAPATFAILTSTGALTGQFNPTITFNSERLNDATLSYDAHDVFLSYGQTFTTLQLPPGATINEQNVANGINNFILAGNTPLPSFQNLAMLSGASLLQSLDQLDGEVATGAQTSAFQLGDEFLNLMLNPFVNGRGYASGAPSGPALGFAPDERANLPEDVALAYAAILGKAQPKPTFDQRWSVWGTAYGAANATHGDPVVVGSHNITTGSYGLAAGMDYRVAPNTIAGFALAGAGTNWGLANALGTGRSDALQAGVYGINWFGPAYIAAALSFSDHWFTTNRSALGDQLSASFDGQSYGARIEGGYRYALLPTFALTPYAAMEAQDFHTPAYGESDPTGGGFGLSYNSMNATDVRTELGTRFDAPTLVYAKPLVLYGRVAWAHDFVNNPALSAAFALLPGSNFTVFGAPIPHDFARTTAGAQLFLSANWSLIGTFNGDFAPGSQTYGGFGTLRYTW